MPLSAEKWQRVKELFDAAADLSARERAALLERECAGDAALHNEVESLLEADEAANSFIENPAAAIPRDLLKQAEEELGGRQFGAYRVLRELGRGGLGAVYLAERADDQYRKQVAIKIVKRGLDTDDILQRFRAERQILAQLDHPNIARLLDAGSTEDGLPYFVMEHVDGRPISDYCDAHQLSTRERLELFRLVCGAVTYAHQHLVIHRDIKPSNILVNEEGVPKLLDFGIAKVLHADDPLAAQTMTGVRVMTPEYASPEQVRGQAISTATDIYSLGVLLYELLTGRRPYRLTTSTPEEISRAVLDQVPERPSTAVTRTTTAPQATTTLDAKSLRGDVDNIVLMALRKEPTRRYASVGQFSDDIRRYLEGRPVLAHKDTLSYRAGKFIRRNKVGVAAAALVLLSLVGGIIATAWQARRAEANQARAEKRFADVRGLANALLNDIAPKIERLEGSTEARQALVTQSLRYLDSLANESADDLTLQAELAAAYEKVGVLQGDSRKPSLSDFRGAIASLEKAQQIRRRLLASNPGDAQNRRLLADNLRLLAIRRMAQSDVDGGFRDVREALQLYEKLAAEQPGSLPLRRAWLEAQIEEATNYVNLARDAEAVPLLQRAAAAIDALHREHEGDVETTRILARCLASLGLALSWSNRQPEAEAEMARAVPIAETLAARFPNDTNLKQELWKIYESAAGIFEENDDARAFELCDRSRQVAEEMIAIDRANAQGRHNLSKSYSRLGISAANLGRLDEAIDYLERTKAIVLQLQEKDPLNRGYDRDLSAVHIRIGVTRGKQRDFAAALAAHLTAAELYERQLANDPANTICLRDSAIAYRHAGVAHKELAESSDPVARQHHIAGQKENYRRALDALLKAQSVKALPEATLHLVATLQKDIAELEAAR